MMHSHHTSTQFASACLMVSLGITGLVFAEGESRPAMSDSNGLSSDRSLVEIKPELQSFGKLEQRYSGRRCGVESNEWTPRGDRHDGGIKLGVWKESAAPRPGFDSAPRGNDSGASELIQIESAMKDPFGFGSADLDSKGRHEHPLRGPACDPMDLDENGQVDIADFELLVAAFGTAEGDLDHNRIVDGRDLGLMLIRIASADPKD